MFLRVAQQAHGIYRIDCFLQRIRPGLQCVRIETKSEDALKLFRAAIAAVALVSATSVGGETFPSRPITILNGFPPGGNLDIVARQIAARLEVRLGQPVIVDNRPGASGTIAAAAVAKAKGDGYTLLLGVAANLATAPAAMKTPPYDPTQAFTPIIEIASGPYIWLVRADAPARNFAEFVSWVKNNPGKLNYGSPGIGSVHHFTTEMMKQAAGVDLVHIPFRGSSYTSLLAGDIQAMFETMPGPIPFLETGKIRALAITGPSRLPGLPDVPTLAELGISNIDTSFWWGIAGPAGMPRPIVDRLNSEIAMALGDPATKATFAKWNISMTAGTPEAFSDHIVHEYARWKEIVTKSGIQLE